MGSRVVETSSYFSRWSIVALRKTTDKRKIEVALLIQYFYSTCCTSGDIVKDKDIPTGKFDRVMTFGVLIFVNSGYSKFITRFKNVLIQCLSYKLLLLYGSLLIELIKNVLLNHILLILNFSFFIPDITLNEIFPINFSLLLTF